MRPGPRTEGGRVTATQVPPSAVFVQLPDRPLTLDDITELAANDELHRYELVEGNLLVMPPADAEQAEIITRIVVWLVVNGYKSNRVLATPGLRIAERRTGLSPDILVLREPAE